MYFGNLPKLGTSQKARAKTKLEVMKGHRVPSFPIQIGEKQENDRIDTRTTHTGCRI